MLFIVDYNVNVLHLALYCILVMQLPLNQVHCTLLNAIHICIRIVTFRNTLIQIYPTYSKTNVRQISITPNIVRLQYTILNGKSSVGPLVLIHFKLTLKVYSMQTLDKSLKTYLRVGLLEVSAGSNNRKII